MLTLDKLIIIIIIITAIILILTKNRKITHEKKR